MQRLVEENERLRRQLEQLQLAAGDAVKDNVARWLEVIAEITQKPLGETEKLVDEGYLWEEQGFPWGLHFKCKQMGHYTIIDKWNQ